MTIKIGVILIFIGGLYLTYDFSRRIISFYQIEKNSRILASEVEQEPLPQNEIVADSETKELELKLTDNQIIQIIGSFPKGELVNLFLEAGIGEVSDFPALRISLNLKAKNAGLIKLPLANYKITQGQFYYRLVVGDQIKTGRIKTSEFKARDIAKNKKKYSYFYQLERKKIFQVLTMLESNKNLEIIIEMPEFKKIRSKKCELAYYDQWIEIYNLLSKKNLNEADKIKVMNRIKTQLIKINSINF